MPTYEFKCPNGHEFDRFYKTMSAAQSELPCPDCTAVATRQLSGGAGLLFKGSGFYLTDYGKNAHRKTDGGAKSEGGASKSEGREPKTEGTKPESAEGESAKADSAKPKAESPKSEGTKPKAESPKPKTESRGPSSK